MKNGKNGKSHVLTLQNLEDDSLQFDLSTETLEELFEWYQVAWDITQRELSKEYNRQHEVSSTVRVVLHTKRKPDARTRGAICVGLQQTGSDRCLCPIPDQTAGRSGKERGGCYGDVRPGGLLPAAQQREGPLW